MSKPNVIEESITTTVLERIQTDIQIRAYQKPKVPPTPSLTGGTFQLSDGSTQALVTVTWSPVRKDIDYIVRWKKSSDSNYTYERARTSPHVIRPLETNTTINVALAAEFRQTGSRSGFSSDANFLTDKDTTPPPVPVLGSVTANTTTGTIHISWGASNAADLATYVVRKGTSSGGVSDYVSVYTTVYEDLNVSTGTTYFYDVRAVDRSGNNSAQSAQGSAIVFFLGTISLASIRSATSDPGASLSTALSQTIQIPAGTQFINLSARVENQVLIGGADTLNVRMSVNSADTLSTAVQQIAFTSLGQTIEVQFKINVSTISGANTLLYEWQDVTGNTSTFQLVAAGSAQATAT